MPRPEIEEEDREFDGEDAFEDGVALGEALDEGEPISIAQRTRTDDHPGGVVIYPHGFSARYRVHLPKAAARAVFAKIGWRAHEPEGWKTYTPKAGRPRYVMQTPAWLGAKAPKSEDRTLTRFNRKWKVRLYNVVIEEVVEHFDVDLDAVRHDDVARFFEHILGLTRDQYSLRYYRRFERFIVLDPVVAFAFAEAYGGQDRFGGGRLGWKRFLIRDRKVDVGITIRTRATAYPTITLYRIEPSATAAFKLEVRLDGNRAGRGQFEEADIAKLDTILLDIVDAFALTTVLKPARWEPRDLRSRIERSAPDPYLGRLPLAAYHGRRQSAAQLAQLRECHTPEGLRLVATSRDDGTFPPPRRVRRGMPPLDVTAACNDDSLKVRSKSVQETSAKAGWNRVEGGLTSVALYRHAGDDTSMAHSRQRSPVSTWDALAQEIARLKGYLSEVVLDADQSPTSFLDALITSTGSKVGISLMALADANGHVDTWQPVLDLVDEHPLDDDIEWLVLLLDTSIAAEAEDPNYTFDEEKLEWVPRTTFVESTKFEGDPLSRMALPVGAYFWGMLRELRDLCEHGGLGIVLITTDFRRPTAYGEMLKTHYFTDARVRSLLGDAGRYWCHQRYRIEGSTTVALKDEAEGKTGRYIR